jgi:hypothetical protein
MSAQSINTLNSSRYLQESEEFLLDSFEKYFFHKNFKVGEGIKDFAELKHNVLMKKLICEANCEVSNFIRQTLSRPEVQERYCRETGTNYILTEDSLIITTEPSDKLIYI